MELVIALRDINGNRSNLNIQIDQVISRQNFSRIVKSSDTTLFTVSLSITVIFEFGFCSLSIILLFLRELRHRFLEILRFA